MKRKALALLAALLACTVLPADAGAITLNSAGEFGLLGAAGVSNTGSSFVIEGNVGSAPASAVSGFPPGQVINGILYTTPDPETTQAHKYLVSAYGAAEIAPGGVPGPADLGGVTLEPGVYIYETTAPWTAGNLTLDGNGDPAAEWIFQIGTGLTTPANAQVLLVDGASVDRVFWQVGSSATLGANNDFAGSILALTSISLGGGVLRGRALVVNGLVSITTATTVFAPEPRGVLSLGAAWLTLIVFWKTRPAPR